MIRWLLYRIGLRSKLSFADFRFSDKDVQTLQSFDMFQRAMLYRVCEVVRLCNEGEKRYAAEAVRELLMQQTRSANNLLPHEMPPKQQKVKTELPHHPLLPRFDLL